MIQVHNRFLVDLHRSGRIVVAVRRSIEFNALCSSLVVLA